MLSYPHAPLLCMASCPLSATSTRSSTWRTPPMRARSTRTPRLPWPRSSHPRDILHKSTLASAKLDINIFAATINDCNSLISKAGPLIGADRKAQVNKLLDAPHDPDDDASATLRHAAHGANDGSSRHSQLKAAMNYKKVVAISNNSLNKNKNSPARAGVNKVKVMACGIDAMEQSYKLPPDATWKTLISDFILVCETTLVEGLVLYHCGRDLAPARLQSAIKKEMLIATSASVAGLLHPAILRLVEAAQQMEHIQ